MAETAAKIIGAIASMEKGLFIDGAFSEGQRKETFPTYNPATGEVITRVSRAYEEDVDRAVKAAKAAFRRGSPWRTMDATARGALLWKLADLMERDRTILAGLDAMDNGKPFADAFGIDLHLAIKCFRYYSGWADKITENAPPTNYTNELTAITAQLVAYAAASGGKTKLAFAHTTPYICTAQQDGCVQTLNHWADAVMAQHGIPVLDTYEAVIAECGAAPQSSCFGENGCWCPHCNSAGYQWLASTIVSPSLRKLLQ